MIIKCFTSVLLTLLISIELNGQTQISKKAGKGSFQKFFDMSQAYRDRLVLDSALITAEKCLLQAEKEFGKRDSNYVKSLSLLVELSYMKGNYKSAVEYCLSEKKLREEIEGKNNSGYASCINNLAQMYHRLGDYPSSESLYKEAIQIHKDFLKEKSAGIAHPLEGLAILYQAKGNHSEAEELYLQACNIRKEILGENSEDYAQTIYNLAGLYVQMANYSAAEPLYKKVLAINKATIGERHPNYAMSLNSFAMFYGKMGNYKAAEQMYLEAKKNHKDVVGEDDLDYSNILNNLALCYHNQEEYAKAEPLYLQSLAIRKKSGEKVLYAASLNNLAVLYKFMEKFDKSLEFFIEALAIRKEMFGEKHLSYAESLSNLGSMHYYLKNYSEAEPLLIQGLKIRENALGQKHPASIVSRNNLAGVYYSTGKYDTAEALYLQTISLVAKNIQNNFHILSEREKELYFKTQNAYYATFYSFANTRKLTNAGITGEVYNRIIGNKGLLLKSSTALRASILNSKDSILQSKYLQWLSLNKEIVQLYSTDINKRKKNPEDLEKQANEIEKDLVKSTQSFNELEKLQNLNWQSIQKNLKSNEATVEFVHFPDFKRRDTVLYCALVLTPNSKSPEMIELFIEKDLIKLLAVNGETNETSVSGLYGKRTAQNTKLYELIWKPLEKSLKSVKTIYYSPSGLLHKISFASISSGRDAFLCDKYNLNLQGSTAKVALPEKADINAETSAIVLGAIQYDKPKTEKDPDAIFAWNYLEGTRRESQKVSDLLRSNGIETHYFFSENATESVFRNKAPQSNIVHVATHGFFFPDPDSYSYKQKQDTSLKETIAFRGGSHSLGINTFVSNKNPLMRSGLAFAGANEVWVNDQNKAEDDGVLTAQEVTVLDLRKTNLLVLSACETGLGDIKGSEGVYGLQRAFKMAGVKFIIMSLWQVPDAETVEFMELFYSKLTKTKKLRLSFNEAQKAMRKKYDPYYWAAFVLLE